MLSSDLTEVREKLKDKGWKSNVTLFKKIIFHPQNKYKPSLSLGGWISSIVNKMVYGLG